MSDKTKKPKKKPVEVDVLPETAAPDEMVPIAELQAHGKRTVTLLRCDVDGHESVENPCPVCGADKELR